MDEGSEEVRPWAKHCLVHADQITVCVGWVDRGVCSFLDTTSNPIVMDTCDRRQQKSDSKQKIAIPLPQAAKNYQSHMRAVDTGDMLKATYGFQRASSRWWKNLFFMYIVKTVILNGRILWNMDHGWR